MTAPTPRAHPGDAASGRNVEWGEYAAAVHRWELITGRAAPYPTQPGRHGRPVLAPPFVEWLMGLPPGWATADGLNLPRTAQLRALGNGVMPQQAAHALTLLLDDLTALDHPEHTRDIPKPQPQPSTGTAPRSRPAHRHRERATFTPHPRATRRRKRPPAPEPARRRTPQRRTGTPQVASTPAPQTRTERSRRPPP